MNESILETVAKAVGIGEGYDHFNDELIMHIESPFLWDYAKSVSDRLNHF